MKNGSPTGHRTRSDGASVRAGAGLARALLTARKRTMNTIVMASAGVLDPTRGGEHIDRPIRGRSITESPTHRAICERYYAEVAEIDGTPWNDAEKTRRKGLAREAAHAGLAKDLEDAIKARSREFEQAEGMAVAAARRDES